MRVAQTGNLKWVFLCLLGFLVTNPGVLCEDGYDASEQDGELTGDIAVHIPNGADPDMIAARHGYVNKGMVGALKEYYVFGPADNVLREELPPLEEAREIAWMQPQVAKKRIKRVVTPDPGFMPTDPQFSRQWHLLDANGVDVNVLPVWRKGYKGQGITIGIVDDGLEVNNPDLNPNFAARLSYDMNYNRPDPTPADLLDTHGTEAAGVAAAVANSRCGVGSAFAARVAGIKILARPIDDSGEASGLGYKCEGDVGERNDIYSCSWGPADDGQRLDGPGRVAKAHIEHCIRNGRGKKGSIYVWACGNGRREGDNINYDGYANLRYTIPIGSLNDNKDVAWYSESGTPLMAVAPGSGGRRRITTCTTTISHPQHDAMPGCAFDFGGTSAASPLAAGVLALVLQANPELGWRDVQHIIAHSSRRNFGGTWPVNGAGLRWQDKFGFGLLDADAAVTLAEQWVNVPPERVLSSGPLSGGSFTSTKGLKMKWEIPAAHELAYMQLEHVEVNVSISAQVRGSVELTLTSPSGMVSRLQERHRDTGRDISSWTYLTVAHWGEHPVGNWSLTCTYSLDRQNAVLRGWGITMYGITSNPNTNTTRRFAEMREAGELDSQAQVPRDFFERQAQIFANVTWPVARAVKSRYPGEDELD